MVQRTLIASSRPDSTSLASEELSNETVASGRQNEKDDADSGFCKNRTCTVNNEAMCAVPLTRSNDKQPKATRGTRSHLLGSSEHERDGVGNQRCSLLVLPRLDSSPCHGAHTHRNSGRVVLSTSGISEQDVRE